MIKRVNIKQFAEMMGVCRNTFKKLIIPIAPPPIEVFGTRMAWDEDAAKEFVERYKNGEYTQSA